VGFRGHADAEALEPKGCYWHEISCTVSLEKALLLVLVPKLSCLVAAEDFNPKECSRGHGGSRESSGEYHFRNFERIVELSTKSQLVPTVYAFQYLPFPFCVTEPVKDNRLQDYLLEHRREKKWLSSKAVHDIAVKILACLDFLNDQRMVQRDLTSHNLIVVPTTSGMKFLEVLPSGQFVIKFASLGLVHQNTSHVYNYDRVIQGNARPFLVDCNSANI
jgi:hypothetical protein